MTTPQQADVALKRDQRSVAAVIVALADVVAGAVEVRDDKLVREREWRSRIAVGHDYRSTRMSTERGLRPYVVPVISSSDPTSRKLPLLSSNALVSPARYHALPFAGGGS